MSLFHSVCPCFCTIKLESSCVVILDKPCDATQLATKQFVLKSGFEVYNHDNHDNGLHVNVMCPFSVFIQRDDPQTISKAKAV